MTIELTGKTIFLKITMADQLMRNKKIIYAYLVFGIAMAYLESVITEHLQLLYYPNDIYFPLKIIPKDFDFIEIWKAAVNRNLFWFGRTISRNKLSL